MSGKINAYCLDGADVSNALNDFESIQAYRSQNPALQAPYAVFSGDSASSASSGSHPMWEQECIIHLGGGGSTKPGSRNPNLAQRALTKENVQKLLEQCHAGHVELRDGLRAMKAAVDATPHKLTSTDGTYGIRVSHNLELAVSPITKK